jgi:hypothetical protein
MRGICFPPLLGVRNTFRGLNIHEDCIGERARRTPLPASTKRSNRGTRKLLVRF